MVVAAVETAIVANIDRIGIVAAGSNNCVVAAIAAETVVCTVVVAVVVASVVAKIAAVVYWPVAVADAAGVVGATIDVADAVVEASAVTIIATVVGGPAAVVTVVVCTGVPSSVSKAVAAVAAVALFWPPVLSSWPSVIFPVLDLASIRNSVRAGVNPNLRVPAAAAAFSLMPAPLSFSLYTFYKSFFSSFANNEPFQILTPVFI